MSVRVFDLVPASDSITASFEEEFSITCIEGAGNNVFVGSSHGDLVCFSVQESQSSSAKPEISFSEWNKATLPSRKPILSMSSASALNRLLVLCDGMIFILTLENLQILGNSKLRNVVCFAVNWNPTADDPFILEIVIGIQRRSIYLATVSTENITIVKEVQTEDVPVTLGVDGPCLCYATDLHYYLYDTSRDRQQPLFPINTQEVTPVVQRVDKEEFLLTGMQGLGVFANADGVSNRPPVFLGSERVRAIAMFYPYIVSLSEQFISVHSVLDQQLKQKVPFSDGRSLKNFDGQLFIATKQEIYKLNPVSWDKQVEMLLNEKNVENALEVAETAINRMTYDEKLLVTFNRLKQMAGFIRLEELQWNEAKKLFIEAELDLRELISLYPGMLPLSSSFIRQVPPLHSIPDINHLTQANSQVSAQSVQFLKSILLESRLASWTVDCRKEIDTCILKLVSNVDAAELEELLNGDFSGDVEDCVDWLTDHQCHHALAALNYSRFHYSDSFAIWRKLETGDLIDSVYPGLKFVADKLTNCENTKIILQNFSWIIERDENLGFEILLSNKHKLDRDKVVIALEPYPGALINYLENIVNEENCQLERFHTNLATLYLSEIKLKEGDDKLQLRQRFRSFLLRSSFYNVDLVLEAIRNDTTLDVERAFLMGKNGKHEDALEVLVQELHDHSAAEEYCAIFGNEMKRMERQQLYLALLKAFLRAQDHTDNGVDERVINLLNRPDLDADLVQVLQLLPCDWSLSVLGPFILRCVQRLYATSNLMTIGKCLAEASVEMGKFNLNDACRQPFILTEKTRCAVCNHVFVDTDFYLYPTGAVVHRNCIRHKHICPATNTVFQW